MDKMIARLEEKKQKIQKFHPLPQELIKNLDEWFRVELTYTSNAIEGNTLTRQETALVVEKGLTVEGKTLNEQLEAVNHAAAISYIKTLALKKITDISEKQIKEIHHIILRGIDDHNAGAYRNVSVRIAGSRVIMPNPLKVPHLMDEFVKWPHSCKEHPVKVAASAHFKLVSIHPFVDGNGRAARLLMNLILMQNGFPPAIIKKEDRLKYINSIEKGQLDNKLDDYYKIIYDALDYSLDIYLDALQKKEPRKEKEQKLLKIGELARLSGETVPTIRYWTSVGLLSVKDFTASGYQLYLPDSVKIIKKIRHFQKTQRLKIEEIKGLLNNE